MVPVLPVECIFLFFATLAGADLDDRELAVRIKNGDERAFETFFQRHHATLLGYLRRRGIPDAVAEDILQNAFLSVWERRQQIDEDKSIRAFLFRIGHNRALNHFRDSARLDYNTELVEQVSDSAPDLQVEHATMRQTLHTAVAALPERRRAVFELCFLQELTYREAAETLGISIKTVENQMAHALKAVRKSLSVYL